VTEQYSKLETPEAQLEYLLLFVCRSRSASSRATLPNPVQMPERSRTGRFTNVIAAAAEDQVTIRQ
jgi:hypothetical protein